MNITEEARRRLTGMMRGEPSRSLRIIVGDPEAKSPLVKERSLAFIKGADKLPDDIAVASEGFEIYIDGDSQQNLEDAMIDFNPTHGFTARNVIKADNREEGSPAQKLQAVLDEHINPAVAAHGGRVTLLDVRNNTAYVEFGGGCQGCGMVNVTLKQGVEVVVKEFVPEIEAVVDVTDHAGGTNPFYRPSSK